MLAVSLPDTLQEWYSLVSGMNFEEWSNTYRELSFWDWYQKYKCEIDAKYIFWSDFPDHNSYKGQGHILSASEFQSMFSGASVTDGREVYRVCATHKDCNCSGSLWGLVKFDTRCPRCHSDKFLTNETLSINEDYTSVADVYCDNRELRRTILLHKPVAGKLFSHEVAMLAYTTFGQYTTASRRFAGMWKYGWHVEYPEFLFHSLVSRGYIRECTDDEILDYCKMEDLRLLLNAKDIKPGIKKVISRERAKEAYTGAEAAAVLGFKYYVLTEAGKNILNKFPEGPVYENIITPLAKHWDLPYDVSADVLAMCNNLVDKRLRENDVKIVDTSIFELNILKPSYKGSLYLSSVEPHIEVPMGRTSGFHCFHEKSEVNVFCDDVHIRLKKVTHLMVLPNLRKLIFGTQLNEEKVGCACVDLVTSEKLFEELIPAQFLGNPSSPHYNNHPCRFFPDTLEGIISDGCVNYYLSPVDEISELILNTHYANKYKTRKLPAILEKDTTSNYCISIPLADIEDHRLLMFMIIDRKLQEPQVMGAKIFDVLFNLCRKSDYQIIQMIMDNESEENESIKHASDSLLSYFNGDFFAICNRLREIFPNHALQYRPFGSYTAHRDENFTYAYVHQEACKKQYNDLLLSLKEKGIIESKWISEFSLYLLIKSYFGDASYQYRADWLGQQSLDIFIPSLDLAFEYQGIQHSKPVELFGGEEHFRETVERDKRKKTLCDENNIKLTYWNYDEPIEDNILSLKLSKFGIDLPNKKSFPEISVDFLNKPKPKESAADKFFVYQYDKAFNLVATFATAKEAAEAVGVSNTSINKSLRGERLLAGGYFWYKGKEPISDVPEKWKSFVDHGPNAGSAPKRVRQLDTEGNFIAEFSSIGQAAKTLCIGSDGIRAVLNGKQKVCHGYKWELV